MKAIRGTEIENALHARGRVYLCGQLQGDNPIDYYRNEGYEIGISQYDCFKYETPHLHAYNVEYNYVIEGCIKVVLINQDKEFVFEKGDLFIIEPNEPHVGKAMPGSRTIFSKVPGGNDKVLVPTNDRLERWGASWEAEYK